MTFSIEEIITIIAALLGGTGVVGIFTARRDSKRSSIQSENEARAQFTSEFSAMVAQQDRHIERQDRQIERLSTELSDLHVKVDRMNSENAKAEDYIDALISGIANGTIPPIPPRA